MSFPAKYAGKCTNCGERFSEGDLITWCEVGVDILHDDCDFVESQLELKKNEEVCTDCWLVKPCGC